MVEGGGGGGALIVSHISKLGPFFGVQNIEFHFFWGGGGGSEKRIFFWVCHTESGYFWGVAKNFKVLDIPDIFGGKH